jgi:hypothetical protein
MAKMKLPFENVCRKQTRVEPSVLASVLEVAVQIARED